MLRKVPLIVILGSTGTGKTKLSIELARRFNAEIISADSMQVYKGLSIATAKATSHERSQAIHHMLDVVTTNEPFTVTHFRDMVLPIIDNLIQSSKMPIIVGGTNYYIESILWHNLVSPGVGKRKNLLSDEKLHGLEEEVQNFLQNSSLDDLMANMESIKLYEYLKLIDPPMANRLHPNNKRKIMRALEVFKDHGERLSDILKDQRRLPGASILGGPQRFQNVIIFWLQCEQETLNQRLDARIDSMVKDGLLKEIRTFYDEHVSDRNDIDYEKGVLQTIGFKEFIPYLEAYDKTNDDLIDHFVNASESCEKPQGWKMLEECLEELKLVTKRYSKKQLKWIRNRFLGRDVGAVPLVYPLDTSDVKLWNDNVMNPAFEAVEDYLNERSIKIHPVEKIQRLVEGSNEETSFFCDVCKRVFIGDYQWKLHMNSNKHKRAIAGMKKREKLLQQEANVAKETTDN
ncbi:CLUMA_CG009944, isoform A [Clunio marinus]|uniref:CLUMA_CG009944, isoform A n=1 Tax=Clunio marinus TaxID=568069 RepID=A0A1J1IEJ0_9DIPT|nr:CLUMA_CG009944, isoform A [Clunio marinus]